MKKQIDSQTLSTLLNHYMSNRAAAFVTVALFRQHGLTPRNSTATRAAQHSGNDKTVATLAKLSPMTLEQLADYVENKLSPAVAASQAKAEAAMEEWRKQNPIPEWTQADTGAANEWWNREGKYEEEIEERGEAKYFHHEQEIAEREGRTLSARQYVGA